MREAGVRLLHGDCLDRMSEIADGSVDMILADLPYGTTACKWDTVIPFEPLWAHYKRLIKRNGAIVLTASQPFTSALVMSNRGWFKYCWVWNKNQKTNFANANRQPLRGHEDVCVFYGEQCTYNPQMRQRTDQELRRFVRAGNESLHHAEAYGGLAVRSPTREGMRFRYPDTQLNIPCVVNRHKTSGHSSEKPVALMEYLIRTYTNEGETVLDNTMGSGTTGVACVNTGRDFIGIEKDAEYFAVADGRIQAAVRDRNEQLAYA